MAYRLVGFTGCGRVVAAGVAGILGVVGQAGAQQTQVIDICSWQAGGTGPWTMCNVGIGTSNPQFPLHVIANAGNGARAIYGLNYGSTGAAYGVVGQATGPAGVGVFGLASGTSGVNYGVVGRSNSPDGYAGSFIGNVKLTGWIGSEGLAPLEIHVDALSQNGSRALKIIPDPDHYGRHAMIGGYWGNDAVGLKYGAVVCGGGHLASINLAGYYGFVGGGAGNTAAGNLSTIPGGGGNLASENRSTVVGGQDNVSSGPFATVGGGRANTASGQWSFTAGGTANAAAGEASFAGGHGGSADHNGAFVWADDAAPTAVLHSSADNQFTVRASGGYRLYSNANASVGAALAPGAGSWSSVSDRKLKDHVEAVDPAWVLSRLEAMPVSTWNYKTQDAGVRHMGPMAQDFHAAFGVGEDDVTISVVDAQGVALAAIQGLVQRLKQEDALVKSQKELIEAQAQELAAVRERIAALEAAQR